MVGLAVAEHHQIAGLVTAYPCGVRDFVPTVNYLAGQTVASAAIVPLSAEGTVCFYSFAPADINGWFAASRGFHGIAPKREFDTRPGNSPTPYTADAADLPLPALIRNQIDAADRLRIGTMTATRTWAGRTRWTSRLSCFRQHHRHRGARRGRIEGTLTPTRTDR